MTSIRRLRHELPPLREAVIFLATAIAIAIASALPGFTGVAGAATNSAGIIFVIFLLPAAVKFFRKSVRYAGDRLPRDRRLPRLPRRAPGAGRRRIRQSPPQSATGVSQRRCSASGWPAGAESAPPGCATTPVVSHLGAAGNAVRQ